MNFELNDEQRQLQESVARLLKQVCSFEQRRSQVRQPPGQADAAWPQLAALGVAGLGIAEDFGGYGGGAVDRLPVLYELGRNLALQPFITSSVVCATALSADPAIAARVLPDVAAGETVLAWAADEATAGAMETRARQEGSRWLLDGRKLNVLYGPLAQAFVVQARTSSADGMETHPALFLVQADAAGLQRRDHRLLDDTPASELHFASVPAEPIGSADCAAALAQVEAAAISALCADLVGAMEGAYVLTVDYLHTRKQFGKALNEYQTLRHRVAEMFVNLEMCRSMALAAAVAADAPDGTERRRDLSQARLVISRNGRFLLEQAVQLHGGIGMTEEYPVGHYLRRFIVAEQLFGDADAHAARLLAMEQAAA